MFLLMHAGKSPSYTVPVSSVLHITRDVEEATIEEDMITALCLCLMGCFYMLLTVILKSQLFKSVII